MATQRNFSTLGTDAYLIAEKISSNQNICRLLEYANKNPFSDELPDLDGIDLIGNRIFIVPKISNEDALKNSSIIIQFDNFITNYNPEFKVATIRFDILCPYSLWLLDEAALRPHMIMQEMDALFNGARLTGIGTLQFFSASIFNIDENIGGYTMTYKINDFN